MQMRISIWNSTGAWLPHHGPWQYVVYIALLLCSCSMSRHKVVALDGVWSLLNDPFESRMSELIIVANSILLRSCALIITDSGLSMCRDFSCIEVELLLACDKFTRCAILGNMCPLVVIKLHSLAVTSIATDISQPYFPQIAHLVLQRTRISDCSEIWTICVADAFSRPRSATE